MMFYVRKARSVRGQIVLDGVDDSGGPLDNEVAQSVFLNEVSVHILLHCLDWLAHLSCLLVELFLAREDVRYDIS